MAYNQFAIKVPCNRLGKFPDRLSRLLLRLWCIMPVEGVDEAVGSRSQKNDCGLYYLCTCRHGQLVSCTKSIGVT